MLSILALSFFRPLVLHDVQVRALWFFFFFFFDNQLFHRLHAPWVSITFFSVNKKYYSSRL